ncbi:olfactory receptor-like protein DTMT [Stigmatopora nigra]
MIFVFIMEWNGTVMLSFGGFVEVEKYGYVYFLLLFPLYVFILWCNCIIIFVIWTHRNLHEPMYIFIAALSINSLLFSTVIYPKLFVDALSNEQVISYQGCLVQSLFFYCLASSDLFLLLAMAYDRYVSICRPLQYSTAMSKVTVRIFLTLAWFVPVFQLTLITVLQSRQKVCNRTLSGFFCNAGVTQIHCTTPIYLRVFVLIVLANNAVIPMFLIVLTYMKIFVNIYHSHGEVRNKAISTCLPHVMVLIMSIISIATDIVIGLQNTVISKKVSLIINVQVLVYNPLINPIMYGLKMKEIWKHLRRLLSCRSHVERKNIGAV